jgi:hypothetical protein
MRKLTKEKEKRLGAHQLMNRLRKCGIYTHGVLISLEEE